MKPIFLFACMILVSFNALSQSSVQQVQSTIDSLQVHAKNSYEIIDSYTDTLTNGVLKLTSVLICGKHNCVCSDLTGFQRRYGLKNRSGKILAPVYDDIVAWGDDLLVSYKCWSIEDLTQAKIWIALIDTEFTVKQVFRPDDFFGNSFTLSRNGKYGVLSGTLSEKIPFEYDTIGEMSEFAEYGFSWQWPESETDMLESLHCYQVKKDGKWGIITENDRVVIPFKYSYITTLKDGLAAANRGDFWGIVDLNDSTILPFEYDDIRRSEGIYILKKVNKLGIVDSKLNVGTVLFEWDEIKHLCNWSFAGRKGKKWQVFSLNWTNEKLYDEIIMDDSHPYGAARQGKKYAIINGKGELLSDFVYTGFVSVKSAWKNVVLDGLIIDRYKIYQIEMIQNKDPKVVEIKP